MRGKCDTAAHQFLKKSFNYDCKELDDILKFMEKLSDNATGGGVGLGSLGAHGEKAFVSADGEGVEKPPCKDDAGLGPLEHENEIELITLRGYGC